MQWLNISENDPDPGSGSKGIDLYFCFFYKDDKAHNVHDKDYIIKIQSRNLISSNS